jgi:hypothetical protein
MGFREFMGESEAILKRSLNNGWLDMPIGAYRRCLHYDDGSPV